ncbi:hypothetical protein BDV27DRAFT_125233 [Aspergillus caelatus]|uniref:Uncharacterized protein n=1 Tax=Aspergillus caelatus TaxID=61420 RepID=A0A5N7A9A5_9EURO|nr:uncharacterized protein BDV27DRAFT_125233 [Aspergillus caelatus]KAE8366412.1 hypothetical protein BDV27DRAFT_125233 [Aspergillus caelatus]
MNTADKASPCRLPVLYSIFKHRLIPLHWDEQRPSTPLSVMAQQQSIQDSHSGIHHGRNSYRYEDGLASLNPTALEERNKLSKLCKDIYKTCLEIDEHFLEASNRSASFDNHPGVEQNRIDAFEGDINAYKDIVAHRAHDYVDAIGTIAKAFANITTMRNLWAPVMSHLSEAPGEENELFNNKPPWTTWVRKLNTITATLPDLLTRIQISPTKIFTDGQWSDIRYKVAFLDETIDYAYTNPWGGFGERGIHLGTATNIKMMARFTSSSAQFKFEEKTNNNPKHGTWRDALLPTQMKPELQIKLMNWVIFVTFIAALLGCAAWRESNKDYGKWNEATQYFLFQTCLMQGLSVAIIILTTPNPFGFWLWLLILGSLSCSSAAPFIYPYSPTQCSATLAFIGSAASNFVILQTMFTVGRKKVKSN